jgi:hypothetical protein
MDCVLLPVTAMFKFPLCDGWLFWSPLYCALKVHVPGGMKPVLTINWAIPLVTTPELFTKQFEEAKFTVPVTVFDELTLAVSVIWPDAWATFVLGTDRVVVVTAGGPLPLAPPHPIAKLSKPAHPNASIGRSALRLDGSRSNISAARIEQRLNIHQDPGLNGSADP